MVLSVFLRNKSLELKAQPYACSQTILAAFIVAYTQLSCTVLKPFSFPSPQRLNVIVSILSLDVEALSNDVAFHRNYFEGFSAPNLSFLYIFSHVIYLE